MKQLGRLIRSASLSGYPDLVRSLGRDPATFMRSVGLSASLLQDPESLIPGDAVRELLEITARATRTEDLALRLAAQRKLAHLGPISLVLKETATPREALDTLLRYLKLVNASLITRIEDTGDIVVIREDLLPSRGLPMRQSVELAVGIMFRILVELIGPQWRPLQVNFTHRAPADIAAHQRFFGRRVRFNQEFNGLLCAAADLSKPRSFEDDGGARLARAHLDAALRDRHDSARGTCRELMQALLPAGNCTAQEVARHLRVDRRTLHRRLEAEGLTFSALLDTVRSELAMRHLRDSDLPLGEVAGLLGFSGPSSFSHWFRGNFGCSASQWRNEASRGADAGEPGLR